MTLELLENRGAGLSKSIRARSVSICRNFLPPATSVRRWTPNAGFTIIYYCRRLRSSVENDGHEFEHHSDVIPPTYLPILCCEYGVTNKTIFMTPFIPNRSEAERLSEDRETREARSLQRQETSPCTTRHPHAMLWDRQTPRNKRQSDVFSAAFARAPKKANTIAPLRINKGPPKIDLTCPMPLPSPTDDPLLLVAISSSHTNDKGCGSEISNSDGPQNHDTADLVHDNNGRGDSSDLGAAQEAGSNGVEEEEGGQDDNADTGASMDVLCRMQEHTRACSVEDGAESQEGEQERDEANEKGEERLDDEDRSAGSALSDGGRDSRKGTADGDAEERVRRVHSKPEEEAQLDDDGNEGWEGDEAEEEEVRAMSVHSGPEEAELELDDEDDNGRRPPCTSPLSDRERGERLEAEVER
ncbi:hypothetical protein B0H14DRAFT_2557421 [Mycena olivaceomarginata]|nr:hypothetical protein B0H14DRAFT_2557421 [Mycena olivaceomarginata]